MLFPVKRLIIENTGYKRDISLKTIYINSSNVVSVVDYDGVTEFLLRENSDLQDKSFSLIRLNNTTDDIIALGSAQQIYSIVREHRSGKHLLYD
tara:strand:+ start:217 stop:498 length:282 start_codon:yes stop_codon:yes gene_type:complete